MAETSIEPFDRARHQRASFRCGKRPLDEFIQTLVTQYEKRRLGKTFVAIRTDAPATVVGYYTLASGAVACADLPPKVARKLPQHPIPVVLLARLAVDQSVQGERIGDRLLADALNCKAQPGHQSPALHLPTAICNSATSSTALSRGKQDPMSADWPVSPCVYGSN